MGTWAFRNLKIEAVISQKFGSKIVIQPKFCGRGVILKASPKKKSGKGPP